MLTIFLGITTLVCGVGWWVARREVVMLIWCWKERKLPPPTDEVLDRAYKEAAILRGKRLRQFKSGKLFETKIECDCE